MGLEINREQIFKAMENARASLGQDFFDGLMRSMENSVYAVLEEKSWYAHYQYYFSFSIFPLSLLHPRIYLEPG